jgi:hypothetical protein
MADENWSPTKVWTRFSFHFRMLRHEQLSCLSPGVSKASEGCVPPLSSSLLRHIKQVLVTRLLPLLLLFVSATAKQ